MKNSDVYQELNSDNMMENIYQAHGGAYGVMVYDKVSQIHTTTFSDLMLPFLDYLQENLPCLEFEDFSSYLSANYSEYAQGGYKIGFNDGIRYFVSILTNNMTQECLINLEFERMVGMGIIEPGKK